MVKKYDVQELISEAPESITTIDELCSHKYTTVPRMQNPLFGEDGYTFKISNVDTNSTPHRVDIQWYIIAGHRDEKVESSVEIEQGLLDIMRMSRLK